MPIVGSGNEPIKKRQIKTRCGGRNGNFEDRHGTYNSSKSANRTHWRGIWNSDGGLCASRKRRWLLT